MTADRVVGKSAARILAFSHSRILVILAFHSGILIILTFHSGILIILAFHSGILIIPAFSFPPSLIPAFLRRRVWESPFIKQEAKMGASWIKFSF